MFRIVIIAVCGSVTVEVLVAAAVALFSAFSITIYRRTHSSLAVLRCFRL